MTLLPLELWNVTPRLDLDPYELNTTCPVTGDTVGLEDHHIWRRSFTALGKEENAGLYWVEAEGRVYPNRVALSPEAHQRVTANQARLAFDPTTGALHYLEHGQDKDLGLHFRLLVDGETVSTKRKTAKKEKPRHRQVLSVRAPVDVGENGVEVLETLIDQVREKYRDQMGWKEDVPVYYVLVAALYAVLTD